MIGKRYLWNSLSLGVPLIAAILVMYYAHQHGRMDLFIAAWVAGFGRGLIGLIRQERLFRRYACPDCGGQLENPSRSPGEPIEYFCPRCDVIWETGFFESSD